MTTTIDTDLRCTSCGYNLRTLSSDAKCPECNAAVSDSILTPDLPWYRAIRQGLSLFIFVTIANVAMLLAAVFILWLFREFHVYSHFAHSLNNISRDVLEISVELLTFWSLWKIGTPRSDKQGPFAYRRSGLRVIAAISLALYFAHMAYGFFVGRTTATTYLIWLILRTVDSLQVIVRVWWLWICISYLLRSIKQVPMAVHADVIRWLVTLVKLAGIALLYRHWMSLGYIFTPGLPLIPDDFEPWELWILRITGIALPVLGLWAFIFFLRTRSRLAQIEAGGFFADLKYFARHIGSRIARGWRFFVTRLRYHGPAPEEEKQDGA